MKTRLLVRRSTLTAPWSLDISRRPLPKGELRIARQFTAGFESEIAQVRKGRLNPFMSYVSSYSHCVFSTKDRRPHRRMNFQKEFIALLKRHKIEYDERYL